MFVCLVCLLFVVLIGVCFVVIMFVFVKMYGFSGKFVYGKFVLSVGSLLIWCGDVIVVYGVVIDVV